MKRRYVLLMIASALCSCVLDAGAGTGAGTIAPSNVVTWRGEVLTWRGEPVTWGAA